MAGRTKARTGSCAVAAAAIAVALLLLDATGALAQTALEQATAAVDEGRHAEAIELLEPLLQDPDAALLARYQLGRAHAGLDQAHQAALYYKGVVDDPDGQRDRRLRRHARRELSRLMDESGRLRLQLDPSTAEVRVDGRSCPAIDGVVLVSPGLRRLTVEAPDRVPFNVEMNFVAGDLSLEVVLGQARYPLVEPEPEPEAEASEAGEAADSPPVEPEPRPAPLTLAPLPIEPIAAPVPEAVSEPPPSPPAPVPTGEDERCLLAPVCLGPVLMLGFTHLLGAGLQARIGDYLGLGVDYQALPEVDLFGTRMRSQLLSGNFRVYPTGSHIFISVQLAHLSIAGQNDQSVMGFPLIVEGKAQVSGLGLGFGLMSRSGFILGVDAGLYTALYKAEVDLEVLSGNPNDPRYAMVADEVRHVAESVAGSLKYFFQFNVLRLGFLF
ncbi:MAG: hypothetical protein OEZ06_14260 [Myxococcales bacterium]|nr:hypothetical protein [Myxococcales bacterium]